MSVYLKPSLRVLTLSAKERNLIFQDFKTPLHYAAKIGSREAISVLLENNADIDLGDNEEMTALHVAAKEGHDECVQLLGEKSPGTVNCTDAKGRSALHLAAISGHR